MRRILPLLAGMAALAAPAHGQAMHARVEPDTLAADEGFQWSVVFHVENPTDRGLYLDSVVVEIADRDSGRTGAERVSRRSVAPLVRSLSAGETSSQSFTTSATCERGELRLLAWGHDGENRKVQARAVASLGPGSFSRAHPSRFFESAGERCEYVIVEPDSAPAGGAPAVLLIHGLGAHARTLLPRARLLARRGFVVMAVSQRGYGLSGGQPDFAGPATLQALSDAVDLLRRQPGVDSRRIGVWGLSHGAGCALGLAGRCRDLAAVVAQAGSYDLWATYRLGQAPGLREAILAQAGRDSAAWRARSPLLWSEPLRAPLLILHGERDERAPPGPAHALYERLREAGQPVEARFFPQGRHELPQGAVNAAAFEFLEKRLKR